LQLVRFARCDLALLGNRGVEPNATPDRNAFRHRPLPVLKYTVASPRACLIGPPIWINAAYYYLPTGDAENFARKNGSLRVPVGTRVIFCLSRDLEAVWYTGSYGCMGTSIVVQYCRLCKCLDPAATDCDLTRPDPNECPYARCTCENCRRLGAVCCPRPDDPVFEPCPWVTIGKDGARDCRKGPSIGRAKVGVPVHFKRPGVYLIRAIVRTFAKPGYPLPLEDWRERLIAPDDPTDVLPEIPPAVDRDVIYVRVRVVDRLVDAVEPNDVPPIDPDVGCIRPMPKDIDPNQPDIANSDLNGDEVVNLADLAIMAQQWGKEYTMPFTDDE